jgi:hypothetical protein
VTICWRRSTSTGRSPTSVRSPRDSALDADAQAAALIMDANGALSHQPPPSWDCWTQSGYDGADNSNLYLFGSARPDFLIDDDDSVFEADIETIAAAGITLGCNPPTNNRYCPDDTVTRGQMAAFLARALTLPTNPGDRFIDDDDSVFEADIETIAAAGITLGCNPPTNNRYCPDDTVTRGQMAAFLTRALTLPTNPGDRFIDDNDSVFQTDIETIAAAGITLGCNPPTNNRYCPDDTVTRGQMAAFLTRGGFGTVDTAVVEQGVEVVVNGCHPGGELLVEVAG